MRRRNVAYWLNTTTASSSAMISSASSTSRSSLPERPASSLVVVRDEARRVVADLLELRDAGEHVQPAALRVGDLGDLVEHGARGRLVERDLLAGEQAVVAHDDALGQLVDDARVGLVRRQTNAAMRRRRCASRSASASSSPAPPSWYCAANAVRVTSSPGLANDMMLHSSSRWFSTGRAGGGDAVLRGERARSPSRSRSAGS